MKSSYIGQREKSLTLVHGKLLRLSFRTSESVDLMSRTGKRLGGRESNEPSGTDDARLDTLAHMCPSG
jgi:hypothetical protein